MTRAIIALRLAAAASLSLLLPGVAMAAEAGIVVGLSGEDYAESGGARTQLKMGSAVQVGDTVEVAANGKLKLRMGDGSIVSVAGGSRLTIEDYRVGPSGQRQSAVLGLGQGLVRSVVAPVQQPAVFEVKTAVGTAAVRSTDWFVEAVPGSIQVGVLVGDVTLTSAATGRGETVPARWGARLEAGRDPVPPRVWKQSEFDAFIERTNVQ